MVNKQRNESHANPNGGNKTTTNTDASNSPNNAGAASTIAEYRMKLPKTAVAKPPQSLASLVRSRQINERETIIPTADPTVNATSNFGAIDSSKIEFIRNGAAMASAPATKLSGTATTDADDLVLMRRF